MLTALVALAVSQSWATAQDVRGPFPPQTAWIVAEPATNTDDVDVPPPPRGVVAPLPPHTLPPTPIEESGLPQPQSPPMRLSGVGIAAPCDVTQYSSATVTPSGAGRGIVCEPTVAFRGVDNPSSTVGFYTGNWFAALSTNSGSSWSYVNPYTKFSAIDGGFCCDQTSLYARSHDVMVWYLQYGYSATTQRGSARVAFAVGGNIAANSWSSYVFTPQGFGRPAGEWLDYPDMAVSSDRIFFTSNIFNAAGQYQNAVIWTMRLSEFVAGSGSVGWWFTTNIGGGGSVKLTRGADDTIYGGTHASNSRMRIFKIVSGSLTTIERNHAAYNAGPYTSLAANGVNWAGRIGDRLTGAYQTPTEYGFLWTASSGTGRPQPYSRISRFRVADDTLIADEDAWASFGIMYPSASGNQAGHIGFTVAAGGAATAGSNPSSFCAIVDDCHPNFAGQTLIQFAGTNNSPGNPLWGDYFSVQPHPVRSLSFVASGMGMVGGTGNANQTPRYAWFGRERDNTAWATTTVWSEPQGVALTCQPDLQGRTGVTTIGYLSYTPNSNYVLTAPLTHTAGGKVYRWKEWRFRAAPYGTPAYYSSSRSTLFLAAGNSRDHIAQAIYDETRPINIGARNATGVAISVSPSDAQGNGNGTTNFTRYYVAGSNVTLTAPATQAGAGFKRWWLNGASQTLGTRALAVAVTAGSTAIAAEAEYYTHVNGSYTQFCAGCPGTGNLVPVHSGGGTPEINNTLQWNISNAVGNAAGVLYIGVSRTTWNGLPLPLNLAFLGVGPTCQLCVSIDVSLPLATSGSGTGSVPLPLPNLVNLIQGHFYTQGVVLDPGAPSTRKLVYSNGLDTLVGGDF
ncbi:MAG: hypothetical protein R3F56_25325 [Planctomycetota bacterium]